MSEQSNNTQALLNELAREAGEVSSYASGLADGLMTASLILRQHQTNEATDGEPTATPYRAKQKTLAPVVDVLRSNGPLCVTDIMRQARTAGHDLLRPSVKSCLEKLEKRGLVLKKGNQFQLVPFE